MLFREDVQRKLETVTQNGKSQTKKKKKAENIEAGLEKRIIDHSDCHFFPVLFKDLGSNG